MKAIALILVLSLVALSQGADKWAVLVAGSNGYGNYRHQSDICHAYHILIDHGMDASKIIVLAYDDIANNRSNPFPGKIFNKPSDGPGKDVYEGCKINYKGNDVTPANYLAILTGDKAKVHGGDGSVLESTADDTVFLNFSDHGASGLIAFPSGGYLYADKLLDALKTMGDKKMYKQLTYYLESCESGSMFVKLPTNTNIYATSAASPDESSWGFYCYPDDTVNGTHLQSCLGDLYSIAWMEDADEADATKETLQEQYETVKARTTKSKVMQWGDISWTDEVTGTFFGMGKKSTLFNKFLAYFEPEYTTAAAESNRLAEQNYLLRKYQENPSTENLSELEEEFSKTSKFNNVFEQFKNMFYLSGNVQGATDYDCYRNAINKFESACGVANTYSYRHFTLLYEFCQRESTYTTEHLENFHVYC